MVTLLFMLQRYQENIRWNGVGYGQSVGAFIRIHEESRDVEQHYLHIFHRYTKQIYKYVITRTARILESGEVTKYNIIYLLFDKNMECC